MKTILSQLYHMDVIFLTALFRLNHRRLLSKSIRYISKSGDGFLYPLTVILIAFFSVSSALSFFFTTCIAFSMELTIYFLLKNSLKRSRPSEKLDHIQNMMLPPDEFSFPSGHTAAAFVMATILASYYPSLSMPVYTWALLVGVSRVYLGLHYPTDILAGIILGISSGLTGIKTISLL